MKRTQIWVFVAILAAPGALPALAQSRALPSGDVPAIYQCLLEKIKSIIIFDHHAHPGYGDDSDVDAQPTPPQYLPFRDRDTNPELVAAVKALFDYLLRPVQGPHGLVAGTIQCRGENGRHPLLGPYPGPVRHRVLRGQSRGHDWLPESEKVPLGVLRGFVPLPFDDKTVIAENPDEGVYIPLQEKVLRRYMQQASLSRLPNISDEYLAFVTRILGEPEEGRHCREV
jgi:hypothetical protein